MAAGTGLALYGISRRRTAGWMMAALGGMLVQRGATGHCHTYEALGINTAGTGEDTRRALGGAARHPCRGERHDQSADRGALPLLAEPRKPAAVHDAPRVGRADDRHAVALARQGPGGNDGRVERRDHQRGPEPGHRLAIDRRIGCRQRRFGELRRCRPGTRHARPRAPAVQPAGRQVGAAVARCSAATRPREIREDLRRFKQIVETGEVPSTEGQPRG